MVADRAGAAVSLLPPDLDWRKARSDLGLSFASQLLAKLVGYVLLAVLARHLSRASFGQFLYAAAVASTFVLVTDLGTRRYLVREAAAAPGEAFRRFSQVLSLRLPALLAYVGLVAAFAFLLKPDLVVVLLLTSLYVGLRSLWGSAGALLLGLRRVGAAVAASTGSQLLLLAVVLVLVARGTGLVGILWGYAASYAALVVLGLLFLRLRVGRYRVLPRLGGLRGVARAAFPFFMIEVLEVAHFKVDTLMLGFFRPYSEVALYEGSAKLLEASQFMMRPLMAIFLPVCAGLAARDAWPELERLVRGLLRWAGGLGAAIAAVVVVVAGPALTIVYGPGFEEAAPLLRILYLAVPLLYLSFVSLFVANAVRLERRAVRVLLWSVAANVALNLALIPPFGATAAAATTVATHLLLAGLLVRLNGRGLRRRRSRRPTPRSP